MAYGLLYETKERTLLVFGGVNQLLDISHRLLQIRIPGPKTRHFRRLSWALI
jgi:hypothetical protein